MKQGQGRQRRLSRNLTVDASGFAIKTSSGAVDLILPGQGLAATSSPKPSDSQVTNGCCDAQPSAQAPSIPSQRHVTSPTCGTDVVGCCPPHGAKAVCGKRSTMEDAYAVFPNLCEVSLVPGADAAQDKLPHRIARQMDHADPSSCESTPPCLSDQEPSLGGSSTSSDDSTMESLHFFGVYDGHGGVQAAQHCAKRLHHHLYSALASLWGSQGDACVLGGSCELHSHESENCSSISHISGMSSLTITDSWGQGSLAPTFTELVQPAEHSSAAWPISRSKSAGAPAAGDSSLPTSPSQETAAAVRSRLEAALHSAFLTTDQEFSEECSSAALVGSTAVVALVGRTHLWVANCGDSRAVLCRNGRAIQLTDDHKPEREDEAERVEKAGGQVLYYNGHRVMGVLAMSRAIGDHCLRPYVIADPEITSLSRTGGDDLMLMASDGLWDVMTNQEAATLALRCLKRAQERGASRRASARIAANVLARAAIDRGSRDNITVLIVDLAAFDGEEDAVPSGASGDEAPASGATCSESAEGNCAGASCAEAACAEADCAGVGDKSA